MLPVEYRLPMPLQVAEYRIGQIYMIAKHSHDNSSAGDAGIEVLVNEPHTDPKHGAGQYTEKRLHLGRSLPGWLKKILPKIFYITERAWNYYPYTITEYTCSFLPRFRVNIRTVYENNKGDNDEALNVRMTDDEKAKVHGRQVVLLDIANDPVPDKYKEQCPDLKQFVSTKTGRGPLSPTWIDTVSTIMCSYKLIEVYFEVWGFQTKVENLVHSTVRGTLLVAHLQAFAWVDEWFGMTLEEVRAVESELYSKVNHKMGSVPKDLAAAAAASDEPQDEADDQEAAE
eukprot:m.48272 g.48272  ORF g.48272 m.48272 type:complete len:285 (-) comp47697_c0_seq1:156-1010(-)